MNIIVTTGKRYNVTLMASRLRAAGMDVQQVFLRSGIIAGSVEKAVIPELLAVEGVLAVEEEGTVRER